MGGPTAEDVLPYLEWTKAAYSKIQSLANSYHHNRSFRPLPDYEIDGMNATQALMNKMIR